MDTRRIHENIGWLRSQIEAGADPKVLLYILECLEASVRVLERREQRKRELGRAKSAQV
jgi:hypothetical protein